MDTKITHTASALVSAVRLAREHGGVEAALESAGLDLSDVERLEGLEVEFGEALAIGYLAGHVAHEPRLRKANEPTSFVMDEELVVQGAEGESIMRLPWFEDDLFVGRQVPDITEMPQHVRDLCTQNYTAALGGERGRFSFTSYGHSYAVETLPVRGNSGGIDAVLAVATPASIHPAASTAYQRTADRLTESAARSDQRAELQRLAGQPEAEAAERDAAQKARTAAERAMANAAHLRSRGGAAGSAPPKITPREIEVLSLASHGLTYAEIAGELTLSVATVRTHLQNIFMKLGVSDKAAAVATALRHGLIE